jgi:hypothetical protein
MSTNPAEQTPVLTRTICAVIVVILIVAFGILYLIPERTAQLFAWTINPPMTPMLMGAGYLAGAYLLLRTALGGRWRETRAVFAGITVFTWCMAVATFLHWDRFNHGHPSFILWLVLYVVSPLLIPFLWWRNRSQDPGTTFPGEPKVSAGIRAGAMATALATLTMVGMVMVRPDLAIQIWPWKLSPLTARVVAGWCGASGGILLMLGFDNRWLVWRQPMIGGMIWLVLIIVALGRSWADLEGSASKWVFAGVVAGGAAGFFALTARHERHLMKDA